MMVYNHQYHGLPSLLFLLVFLVSYVNAQIAEQDETGHVNIQGREKTTPTVTFEAQEEASVTPIFEKAWIYSFSEDSAISEVVEIQGTKSFIIVYKEPDENDVGIEEDIIAATDDAVKSAVIDNGGTVTQEFRAVLNGVAADLTTEAIEALMVQDGIAYIEEDIPVYISQQNPTWGQDRVDQPGSRDGTYKWQGNKSAGQGINVAIIDTGILSSYLQPGIEPQNKHMNLVGGYNVLSTDPDDWNDCHSHGTHVAGTVGSRDYGVAPGATIWAVKVLSCTGGGTSSGVVSGINWVVQQAKDKGGKWVMNMSLGGGFSQTQNDAVEKARDAGIIVVVAAGNNGSTSNPFACNYSPASAKSAITVGSTDSDDKRSSFSNYGECTDIFAPGRDVLSLSLSGSPSNPVASTKSGTSMATPHVAGAAALYYQNFNTATDAENALFSDAVSGKLYDVTSGSPNLLVQVPLALQGLTGFATPIPTRAPTQGPTAIPTRAPTQSPTQGPTRVPSNAPTQVPTRAPVPPTRAPTPAPTRVPTRAPTPAPVPPTRAPTPAPTRVPTRAPTRAPVPPTRAPT
ncbi:peptidase S8/S53 domain containing protein [Nitzschia inconspicua]|uniref:Peptidase S8/S53 domain containing protein n=1 Tax=Nitzschia inconspicua TaxID=303405 RepID=A0A9K3PHN3_9STRA|nr:peptidase S8/S53 domain containing protein [Nitzschia inconspicua]